MDNTWQNLYYDLKADSHREHNFYQKEIDAATKQAAEWEARYNAVHNLAKELHRLAYPERYRLSSGAELVSGWRNRDTACRHQCWRFIFQFALERYRQEQIPKTEVQRTAIRKFGIG